MLYPANQSGCPSIPLQSLTPSNFPSLRCEPRPLGAVHHCNVARPMYVFNLCPVTHTLAKAVLIQSFQPDSSCYSPVPRSGKMSARSRVFSGVFIVPAHRDTPSSDAISSLLEIYIKSRCYGSAQDFTTTYSSYFTLYDTILRSYVPSFSLSFILRLRFCHWSSTHWITFVICCGGFMPCAVWFSLINRHGPRDATILVRKSLF
jgi:hypothetical protein